MNFYNVNGRLVGFLTSLLSKAVKYRNIESQSLNSDEIVYHLKGEFENLEARIKFIEPGSRGVYWSVEDFQGRAEDRWQYHTRYEDAESWEDVYDKSKFQEALNRMIDKHDAQYGITWDTIDFWLDEICLKEEEL